MNTYRLHRWSIVDDGDPYRAPEVRSLHLHGFRDDEQNAIVTSRVMEVNGRTITTRNNIYILEDIHPEYLEWMGKNNMKYDYENPIKMVDKLTPIVVEQEARNLDPSLN